MAERSVKVTVDAVVSGYVSKMRQAEAATKTFASNGAAYMDKHAQGIGTLSTMVGALGAGLTGLAGLAGFAAMSWETSWTEVTKTVNATSAQFDQLEVGLRGLAKTMPETHAQIAEVAAAAGQLGIATDSIVDFTKTMVMLGDSTNLSADEAATSIAQMMNVMHSAPDDVDNLGAALVALGNNGASTERDIIQMSQRIASAAKIVGLSEANVLALSNALASTGVEAEAGGTAISQVLIKISQAVANNGKGLQDWAGVAGLTADQFAKAWKDKPAEALTDVVEGLDGMNKAGKDVFTTLDTLGIQGIRQTTALLNLANGGDLLRKSLQLGDAAWEKNTALVNEANKRYDTTAAKAKIAANVLKDDLISAGEGLLPIAVEVADAVGDVGKAFDELPGPVKSALSILTGVGGISLVAAAGLIKVTLAISATRTQLAAMELSSAGGTAALGRFAKATATAAAAFAAFELAGKIGPSSEQTASVAKFTSALLEAANGGKHAGDELNKLATIDGSKPLFMTSISGVKGLKDAFDALDASSVTKFIGHITPYDDKLDNASKAIKQIDAALTSLATSGSADQAGKAFAYLQDQTGKSTKDLLKVLPNYSDALTGIKNDQAAAAKTTDDLGESLQSMVPLTDDAQKALDAAKQATSDAAMGFLDMSQGLDAAKYSFQSWIKGLEDMAKAQAAWADNLILATNRGVSGGVVDELKKMGPAGAKALDDLAHGTDKDIDRVNNAFNSAADTASNLGAVLDGLPPEVITSFEPHGAENAISTAAKVAKQYHLTPGEIRTILKALDYSSSQIRSVLKLMGVLDGTTARPKIRVSSNAAQAVRDAQRDLDGIRSVSATVRIMKREAEGGVLTYANGGENHTAQIGTGITRMWDEPETGGEAYIPLAPSKRARSLAIWAETGKRLGVQGYANGGSPGGLNPVGLAGSFNKAIEQWIKELNRAEEYDKKHYKDAAALDERTIKSLERLGTKMSNLGDKMSSFSDQVASNFLNDPFNKGGDNGSGGYISNFDAYKLQVATDTTNGRDFKEALDAAAKKGLDGALYEALAASGDVQSAQGIAGSSRKEIAAEERQFNARETVARSLGSDATSVVFAKQLSSLVQEINALRKKTELGSKTIDALSRQLAVAVGHSISSAAGHAQNRATNSVKGR